MPYNYIPPNVTDIFNEVRWLTASGTGNQLSDADIEKFMNSFYLYNLPAKYRSLKLKDKYTFNTVVGQDTYPFDSEHYTTVEMPVYCSKKEISMFLDPWSFYGVNFNWQNIENFTTGRGSIGPYSGMTQSAPLIPSVNNDPGALGAPTQDWPIGRNQNILITANIGFGQTANITDVNRGDGTGDLIQIFNYNAGQAPFNQLPYQAKYGPQQYRIYASIDGTEGKALINYATGDISGLYFQQNIPSTLTFGNNSQQNSVQIQYNSQILNQPSSILFFQNQFVLLPIPDQGYTIEMVAYRQPVQALIGAPVSLGGTSTGVPELSEWWQILAYGASWLIYKRRLDSDGESLMLNNLKESYEMIETRTYAQLGKQQMNTIFRDQLSNGNIGAGFFGSGISN